MPFGAVPSWQDAQLYQHTADLFAPLLITDPATTLTRVGYPSTPTASGVATYFEPTPEVDVPKTAGRTKEWNIFTLDKFWFDFTQAVSDTWQIKLTGPVDHVDRNGYWKVQGNPLDYYGDPDQDMPGYRWVYTKRMPEPAWMRGVGQTPTLDPSNPWPGWWKDLITTVRAALPDVGMMFRSVDAMEVNWQNALMTGQIVPSYMVIDVPKPTKADGWGMVSQRWAVQPTLYYVTEEDNTDLAAILESRLWAAESRLHQAGTAGCQLLGMMEVDASEYNEVTGNMLQADMPLRAGALQLSTLTNTGLSLASVTPVPAGWPGGSPLPQAA